MRDSEMQIPSRLTYNVNNVLVSLHFVQSFLVK